ncbi:MAG: restriction endonuclease subunit S, partial [Thiohalocapsa sp.]
DTLEALARAIFKDWFVDFGPTRAKQEGAAPYLAPEIWDLFPDRLDAEGKPEGWELPPVASVATIRGGKQLKKEKFIERGPVPVFGGAGVMGYTDQYNAKGFVISVGRVGAYCGQFFFFSGKAWINNNASLIVPNEGVSGEWLFFALRALDINLIKKGAAQPFVSNSDIAAMRIVDPGQAIVESFHDLISPLLLRQKANEDESSVLAQTRDLLLPKLMSGEIRLREAEQTAEAVL